MGRATLCLVGRAAEDRRIQFLAEVLLLREADLKRKVIPIIFGIGNQRSQALCQLALEIGGPGDKLRELISHGFQLACDRRHPIGCAAPPHVRVRRLLAA